MNEIPELKESDYENIESSVIDSFDNEISEPVTEIDDVTLEDIVEVKEKDDVDDI